MRAQLHQAWKVGSPRQRIIIGVLMVVSAVGLYVWLVTSVGTSHHRLQERVRILQTQALRLESHVAEIRRLRATAVAESPRTELRTLLQAQVVNTGIFHALEKMEAIDSNQVVAAFAGLAFEDWLRWAISLESQGILVEKCRIEALPTPGMVSVTVTLLRARSQ